jgi:periplasmic protein CpxP/Spy
MKTTLFALLGLVSLTGAACHRGHHDVDPARAKAWIHSHVEDTLEDLDATAAQKTSLSAVEERLVNQGFALKAESKQAKGELLAQFKSPTPDKTRVHALIDARADAYRKFAHDAADAMLEVHQTLTPEQRAKLEKKLDRFTRE